jgi:hypothetical protein
LYSKRKTACKCSSEIEDEALLLLALVEDEVSSTYGGIGFRALCCKLLKLKLRILCHFNSRQWKKRKWIHKINRECEVLGESYTLFPQLLED